MRLAPQSTKARNIVLQLVAGAVLRDTAINALEAKMLIKMVVDHAGLEERPLVRRFLRHLLAGSAIGLLLGACGYAAILLSMGDQSIQIPLLFGLAMLLQAAAVGGLVGAGVFMSRITERAPADEINDETDGDNDLPNDAPL